jgi:hypothetical protein
MYETMVYWETAHFRGSMDPLDDLPGPRDPAQELAA